MTVVQADPRYRKRVFALLGIILLAAMLGAVGLQAWIQAALLDAETNMAQAVHRIRTAITIFAIINLLITAAIAWFFLRGGIRTWMQQRFPPSGMKVLKDTPLRQGGPARILAVLQFALAALTLSLNSISLMLFHILNRVING